LLTFWILLHAAADGEPARRFAVSTSMLAKILLGMALGGGIGYFYAVGVNDISFLLLQERYGRGCRFGDDMRLIVFGCAGALMGALASWLTTRDTDKAP
jgi:hypothetical protein